MPGESKERQQNKKAESQRNWYKNDKQPGTKPANH